MYGVNSDHATGSNVYRLPTANKEGTGWEAIWDAGGDDRIDGSRSKSPVTIDLRNATLNESNTAGGYISSVEGVYGGFTIAHDWNGKDIGESAGLCIIENATGGSADDRLIGNIASNRLRGRNGDDILYGSGGDDVLIGVRGRDQFWIDVKPGSFSKVRDFRVGKDQLVFPVPSTTLSVERVDQDLLIRHGDMAVARLFGVSSLSWDRDALFSGFDGL